MPDKLIIQYVHVDVYRRDDVTVLNTELLGRERTRDAQRQQGRTPGRVSEALLGKGADSGSWKSAPVRTTVKTPVSVSLSFVIQTANLQWASSLLAFLCNYPGS